MKSLNQLSNESLSVCDGCSNWRICKFSEDVKRAEAEYKQYVTNRLTNNLINKYSDTSLTGFPVTRFDSSSTCNTVK